MGLSITAKSMADKSCVTDATTRNHTLEELSIALTVIRENPGKTKAEFVKALESAYATRDKTA